MPEEQEQDSQFAVVAEATGHSKPLVLTHLTFARLIDDVVVPYDAGDTFFVDGVPVKRESLKRIKIIRQHEHFGGNFGVLHRNLRHGDVPRQKIYADQYQTRLDALLRESGEDVTSQVIKAFNAKIKPRLKDYLPKRDELVSAALQLFVESMKALGSH